MIKRWQKVLNQINRLIDFVIILAAYYGATYFWLLVVRNTPQNIALEPKNMALLAILLSVIIVFFYQVAGLYDSIRARPYRFEVRRVILINAVVVLAVTTVFYVVRLVDFSRGSLGLFFLLSSSLVLIKRALVRKVLTYFRSKGYNQKHVILVGSGVLAQKYAQSVAHAPWYGYTIDGYIGNNPTIETLHYYGTWEEVGAEVLARAGIDKVIAALDQPNINLLPGIIAATEKFGTKVSIIPYFNDYIPASTTFETLGDCKLLSLRSTPLDYPSNAIIKRAFDIFSSLILIIVTSPLMLFVAIGVQLSSPGPIIFKQTRVGKDKHLFKMYKFRSMRVNDEEHKGWSKCDDPRKTRFGSLIRKASIDELPQLFNVLKGDMSLIGPRPEVPHFVEQFQETIPLYMLKHLVRPGISGLAQVNGYRGDTSIEKRIQYDIWYIEHWSFWLDLRICIKTVFGGLINQESIS